MKQVWQYLQEVSAGDALELNKLAENYLNQEIDQKTYEAGCRGRDRFHDDSSSSSSRRYTANWFGGGGFEVIDSDTDRRVFVILNEGAAEKA